MILIRLDKGEHDLANIEYHRGGMVLSNTLEVRIYNCNNIEESTLNLHLNRLNVKYGVNGTGKSTIAKAFEHTINNDTESLRQLTPLSTEVMMMSLISPGLRG